MELLDALNVREGCRLCLQVSSDLTPIFQESESDLNGELPLSARISACVGFEVLEKDGLPSQICSGCIQEVDRWIVFRSQAQSTNELLTKVVSEGYHLVSVSLPDTENELSEEKATAVVVIRGCGNLENSPTGEESDSQEKSDANGADLGILISAMGGSGPTSDNPDELDDGNDDGNQDQVDLALDTNDSDVMSSMDDSNDSDGGEEFQDDEDLSWRLKPVKCPMCLKSFSKHSGVKLHLRIVHTKLKLYPCLICGHTSVVSSEREKHIQKKHQESLRNKHTCKLCGLRLKNTGSFTRHRKNHEGARRCKFCKILLDTIEALEEHKRTAHVEELRLEPPPDVDPSYHCHHCENVSFWRKEDWKDHYLNVHQTEDTYPCNMCSKAYRSKRLLEVHQRIHTGEKPFMCEHCATRFTSKEALRNHMRKHTTKFECQLCQKTYTSYSGLYHHTRGHANETPYVCHECGKTFKSKNGLQIHIQAHTGEKPFKCEHCDFVCRYASGLYSHKVIHSEERPFQCDQCDKTFKMKAWLKEHKKTHSGVKNFLCGVCDHAFIAMYQLRSHMKTHTGEKPYICDICSKNFARRDTLAEHMRTHTKEIKYSCDHCNAQFMFLRGLKKHVCAGQLASVRSELDLESVADSSSDAFGNEDL